MASAQGLLPGQPSQPAQPGQPGAGAVDRKAGFEGFMKQRDDRLKTLLGATDDEFAILKPRIDNVQMLHTRQMMQGFRMMMGGGTNAPQRTRPSGDAQGGQKDPNNPGAAADPNARPNPFAALMAETPALVKAQELQTALETKETPAPTIKGKLDELRAARKLAKDELTRAQEELRQLCTVRQEAALVMMGVLE
jgi:hypothetical protein